MPDETGCTCSATAAPLVPRRTLLGLLLGLGATLLARRAWAKKVAVKLDSLPALKKVQGWVVAQVKQREILLVRDGEGSVRATSAACSHQAYRLKYSPSTKRIECANHGSLFDLGGKALKGPATKPLPVYPATLELDKGRVVLTLDA